MKFQSIFSATAVAGKTRSPVLKLAVFLFSLGCSFAVAASSLGEPLSEENEESSAIKSPHSPLAQQDPQPHSHRVVVGDTLWNVAKRLRPSHMSMEQAMDLLYSTNPEAFLDGDSSKLREGFVVSFSAVDKTAKTADSQENPPLESSLTPAIPAIEWLDPIGNPVDNQQPQSVEVEPVIDFSELDQALKAEPQPVIENVQIKVAEEVLEPEGASITESIEQLEVEPPATVDKVDKAQQVKQYLSAQIAVLASKLVALAEQGWLVLNGQALQTVQKHLKQVPMDLRIVGAALFLLLSIRWVQAMTQTASKDGTGGPIEGVEQVIEEQSATQEALPASDPVSDELAESVLDRPFTSHIGDAIFTPSEATDSTEKESTVEVQSKQYSELELPGIQELEAQIREDLSQHKPLSSDLEAMDFVEDAYDIDPLQIKLDMAALCIEMGDIESAQEILEEIIREADEDGKAKARVILETVES
ncbi:MAG: hypothetical protein NZ697_01045 [Porticoccaceae bacterium]|nr:hypothetical protein [Porticoccaceae bacterium]